MLGKDLSIRYMLEFPKVLRSKSETLLCLHVAWLNFCVAAPLLRWGTCQGQRWNWRKRERIQRLHPCPVHRDLYRYLIWQFRRTKGKGSSAPFCLLRGTQEKALTLGSGPGPCTQLLTTIVWRVEAHDRGRGVIALRSRQLKNQYDQYFCLSFMLEQHFSDSRSLVNHLNDFSLSAYHLGYH